MRSRSVFFLPLRFLAHPLTLFAAALLPLNDFLLRRLWPGWWTGKLGDAAWLFAAPGVFALTLAVMTALAGFFLRAAPAAGILARLRRPRPVPAGQPPATRYAGPPPTGQEKALAVCAYACTGLAFALFKTVPACRAAVLDLYRLAFGFPARALLDPTDLLALAVLPLSAALYLRPRLPARAGDRRPAGLAAAPLRAGLVIPLLALFTLADSAMPDSGVACLSAAGGTLTAAANYAAFVSTDGGLRWVSSPGQAERPCPYFGVPAPLTLALPDGQLRALPGQRVEFSRDSGQTWQLEYDLSGPDEVMKAYYQKSGAGNIYYTSGPLSAVRDEVTGSVVFAMGHRGVLVRRPGGSSAAPTYTWAAVGPYRSADLASPAAFVTVLGGELLLTFALALLLLGTGGLAVRFGQSFRPIFWLLVAWAVLAWLAWAAGETIFPPALSAGYSGSFSALTNVGGLVLSVPLAVFGAVFLVRARAWVVLPTALLGALFLLPYAFWYAGALPAFTAARNIALVLALVSGASAAYLGFRLRPQRVQPSSPAAPPPTP
jgi:hypothetical protein